jgi:hypothetical protein
MYAAAKKTLPVDIAVCVAAILILNLKNMKQKKLKKII